ncbi:MAG: adenylyltransferase/cytidyltransferase family protein, partial [Alphaproteobacteria bacterium]|nr:adenylyltransferase/cytidyltransferase family protein [Alphaproteobacteria bacterium]
MTTTNTKIKAIDELGALREASVKDGKTIVMAGGVFDLFHYGHLRHLQMAKDEGDILVVAVTADAHAGKAPGRPVFSENMRAEMVASQEIADYVVINNYPGAEQIIEALKPDIYVKGSEYANPEDDVTGCIVTECETVEKYGGKIIFTDEITFSSSNLINNNLRIFDPSLRDYLNDIRRRGGAEHVLGLIEKVKDYKVLVVGDTIIDDYVYVCPMGKSPKEN